MASMALEAAAALEETSYNRSINQILFFLEGGVSIDFPNHSKNPSLKGSENQKLAWAASRRRLTKLSL